MSFEEDGERISIYWLRCRAATISRAAFAATAAIADLTYGILGRSPDQVAGFVTGLAMNAGAEGAAGPRENLLQVSTETPAKTISIVYAVRRRERRATPSSLPAAEHSIPTLRWCAEEDAGARDLGHEDAGHQRGVCRRGLDRQRPAARAGPEEAGDTCSLPIATQGRVAVVAQARSSARRVRVRRAARMALRRDRQHGAVRRGQGSVGARVRARRRAAFARHLREDAEPLLRQPSVQRALLVEDAAAPRRMQQDRPGHRGRSRCRRCKEVLGHLAAVEA